MEEEAMEYDDIEEPAENIILDLDAVFGVVNPADENDGIVVGDNDNGTVATDDDDGTVASDNDDGRVVAYDDDGIVVVDDDDGIAASKKSRLETPEETPRSKASEDIDSLESDQMCPICMDHWTNSGEHRLCSLRCGHLFGRSCVQRWLREGCRASDRRCPQCNKKAAAKDIRILFARKLLAADTVENERLKSELVVMTREKNRLEMEVTKCHMSRKAHEQQLASMARRIAELERQQTDMSLRLNETVSQAPVLRFFLEKTADICWANGCRVLDYNPWYRCVVASQKSTNAALFSGFGVRKIDTETFQPRQFTLLHNQAIRDIAFHPSERTLLLSVSFDKTVKILDVHNNVVAHGYPAASQLWSGCWSMENPNAMFVGAANGSITEFDIRQTSGAVEILASPGDRSPVVSLATVPSNSAGGMSKGGFVAAHLNSCYAYERNDVAMWTARQMFLDGPFVSVRYDTKNHHALASSRPNSKIPNVRHTVFTIERGTDEAVVCNVIHTFNGGKSQQIMSRPCHINVGNDTFVAAHQESTKSIPLWSVSSGKQMHGLPVSDPVLDMCSFDINNNVFLATLSSSKLRFYKNR